jgi:hypothetical protein
MWWSQKKPKLLNNACRKYHNTLVSISIDINSQFSISRGRDQDSGHELCSFFVPSSGDSISYSVEKVKLSPSNNFLFSFRQLVPHLGSWILLGIRAKNEWSGTLLIVPNFNLVMYIVA